MGVWMSSPLCHSCALVPCPVLFCVRSVGARQGCPGTSGGPRLVLSSVTGGCQAGAQAPGCVATVCPAPARQDFSICALRPHVPPSAFWVAGAFRAEEWGGKTPGTSFCHLSAPSLKLAQALALLLGTLGKVTQPFWALHSLPLEAGHTAVGKAIQSGARVRRLLCARLLHLCTCLS